MTDRHFDNLISAFPLASMLIDPSETIISMNDAACEIFGKAGEGRHYITVLRQPVLLDSVAKCMTDGVTRKPVFEKMRSTHTTRYEATCTQVDVREGKGILISFQDISVFEEAGQMRRDFVANVSHELRTPLTAVLGFIETLRGPAKDDSEARDRFLSIMEHEATRMNRLVEDLLSLSRVESEERMRPNDKQNIVGLLNTCLRTLRPTIETSKVSVHFTPPVDDLRVPGDWDQLQQVFLNLIENAIKYGSSGGDIWIDMTQIEKDMPLRGPAVRIDVRDAGEGIDPLHIPRLTERFYRIDGHRSRELGGTGLGLAIVKHIINRHRGRLKITSELGKGSCFSVYLPV
ncbi:MULTISPECIES: ATP-binding protein [Halocynthiibacter]|uniref:histidine kinase n=1 Tax=Halocynthiibacter halioticoli TaxID=2986804 RepID=A0AAE3IZ33_9RHOB|nr:MULTISPECIES: ATP-binding protein [Halocynthiibacter]MCV6824359.1 ATP-binding protein [Halocynthiibacter halioticoli]MCW4057360.1 ATP-binding protein [Halocynthiibacter sp. SDUM655004]